jgi:hypothetical protein
MLSFFSVLLPLTSSYLPFKRIHPNVGNIVQQKLLRMFCLFFLLDSRFKALFTCKMDLALSRF